MIKKSLAVQLDRIKKEGEERAAQRRAEKLGKKYINLTTTPVNTNAVALIPEEEAKKAQIMAIEKRANKIAVVAVNPENPSTDKILKDLESKGFIINLFITSQNSLEHGLNFYKYVEKEKQEITGSMGIDRKNTGQQTDLSSLALVKDALSKEKFQGSNVEEILEMILKAAVTNRASDIHLEPTKEKSAIRFRIDGVLNDIFTFDKKFYSYLISRIKLLCSLKLNVTNSSQDGRFTMEFPGKNIEVRVAIAPAQFGEVIVMRILDPDSLKTDLRELGLREDDLEIVTKELKRPNGMILNTGPTGSGKTTTLYAFLNYKKSSEIKIITIEDPIEYRLSGIEQTQVDEESGYTFANGLKSMMRQDPDIILVGEIRDKETAEIGIQSALTGHLVFSTVHANSASGAIPRLLDLEIKPVSIGPALNLIIGQRLVRRLCDKCKEEQQPDETLKNKLNIFLGKLPNRIDKNKYKEIKLFIPKKGGCLDCNNTGFRGRGAIYELLQLTPEMEELILKQSGELAFNKFAIAHGMTTMQQDGILKVMQGITTFDEVENVTGPIEWEN